MKRRFLVILAVTIGVLSDCQKLERDNLLEGRSEGVEYKSYSINYESVADHKITPGENLRIGINYLSNTSWGASITISTISPYAECESLAAHLDGNSVLLHYPPSYPSSSNGFLVHVRDNAPIGASFTIIVSISSNNGFLSEGSINLTVGESW